MQAGVAAAERLVARQKQRYGEQHIDTALSRGLLGIGLLKSGRDVDALRELKLAVPVLMARSRETDDDDATASAARERRAQIVVESYIALLARLGNSAGVDPATESFRLADAVRSSSVQRALAASSARATAANPALANLVRKTQDLEKQIGAQLGLLNNVLAMPQAERDERALTTLQADIEKMRGARDAAKKDLAGKFRNYANLVEPAPPTVEEVRAVLQPNEAFLSFYFGREASFVWAVGKSGPVAFAAIPATAGDIDQKVQKLREALEPNAPMIADIPPFDTALAHELYTLLLKPVEAGWKDSRNLIVVTNGSLGLLPLGLLTTAPAEVKPADEPLFAGYRTVPWLARTHAVTLVPSAAALRTLRQLPPPPGGAALVLAGGQVVQTSVRELRLLVALVDRWGRIVSREELYRLAWGGTLRAGDRSVDVYVHKLRAKLEQRAAGRPRSSTRTPASATASTPFHKL